jgi:hypothetical protein
MLIVRLTTLGFVAFFLASKWDNLPHPDTKKLQGTWEIVSVEREGSPDPSPVGYTLRFIGNEAHFQVPLDRLVNSTTAKVEPLSEEKIRAMALS